MNETEPRTSEQKSSGKVYGIFLVAVVFLFAIVVLLALDVLQYRHQVSGMGNNISTQDATISELQNDLEELQSELTQASAALDAMDSNFQKQEEVFASCTPLKKSRVEGTNVYYDGELTVSGSYNLCWGDQSSIVTGLCFYPDNATGYQIPRGYAHGNNEFDARMPWFCFSNEEEAQALLGIDRTTETEPGGCHKGETTVVVSDYVASILAGEAWDMAKLIRVEN